MISVEYSYSVEAKKDEVLIIRNVFDVRKPSGEDIFKVERLYGIDPVTGKHLAGYGDKNRDGYLFAPKNPGREFIYWHINYDMPAKMKFRGKEKIEGLLVYRYECDYKADQTENLTFLPGVTKDRGVELDINLQLWVEPTTGYLINYKDKATAWYYDLKTKNRVRPWNSFHNEFEETSISKQVQIVLLEKERSVWQNRYLPLSNFVLILIVLSLAYPERKQLYRPYIAAGLILIIGLSAAILLYFSLKKTNDVRNEAIFTRECESLRTSIQRELERCVDVLNAVKINYLSLREMNREQFRSIATLSLKNNESINGIGWIPLVPDSQRDSLERNARTEGFRDFHLTEIRDGQPIPVGKRGEYFPLYFIEPFENNKAIFGYDLASDDSPKAAMEKATATGEATATALIAYQDSVNKKSFLILLPVYKNELGMDPSQTVHTFLLVRISINSLVQVALEQATISNPMDFSITDPATKNENILYSNARGNRNFTIKKSSTLQVANRHWLLKFRSAPSYSPFESTLFTTLLPIFTALITIILAVFIFRILTENQLLKAPN